jgi:hypothetical protein
MSHSILPPSSAARRVICPGSRALEALCPQEESPASIEGTLAHYYATRELQSRLGCNLPPAIADEATQEMLDGANEFANDVMRVLQTTDSSDDVHIEEAVDISNINEQCWGTPDCWYYNSKARVLNIWDYKFGHSFVEVFENWQLIEYSAGILQKLGLNGYHDQYVTVNFIIVQPRSYHRDGSIRHWTVKASDLRGYFNILEVTERASLTDNANCNPSSQCRDCSARHLCPALQEAALSAIDISMTNTPHDLPAKALGNELRYSQHALALLKARTEALEEQALAMIKRGNNVPFFTVEETQSREKWKIPADDVVALGTIFDKNLTKSVDVATPKQAIKLGIDATIVRSYSITERTGVKLVPENNVKIKKMFGNSHLVVGNVILT